MKNSLRGITLISVVATVVITLILLSAIVISYDNIIENTGKKGFANEIYLIGNQVEKYEFMNNKLPIYDTDINYTISDTDAYSQFSSETINNNQVVLKEIDLNKADIQNVKRGNKEDGELDVYAISETTKKIYYLKGYKIKGNNYYTLTDELKKNLSL